jgi:hypothetical protein
VDRVRDRQALRCPRRAMALLWWMVPQRKELVARETADESAVASLRRSRGPAGRSQPRFSCLLRGGVGRPLSGISQKSPDLRSNSNRSCLWEAILLELQSISEYLRSKSVAQPKLNKAPHLLAA